MKKKSVSLRDVAAAAGVSLNAASLALRHDPQIPVSTRERIEAAARKLGYQRNPATGELMRQLRLRGHQQSGACFALINANEDEKAFSCHPTIPRYVEGIRSRAESLDYHLDPFWLFTPKLRAERWQEIFHARNLRGALVVGMMKEHELPEAFKPICRTYPCVVTGVRTETPELSFSCVDHHLLMVHALQQVKTLGYRRPGMVLDPVIDRLVMGRFTAGFQFGVKTMFPKLSIPVFDGSEEGQTPPPGFQAWLERWHPDVLLTLYTRTGKWTKALGWEGGLVLMELRPDSNEWAGMDQHNELAGEAALDLLVSALLHGETGVPPYAKGVLISPTWKPGPSCPVVAVGGD